MATDVSRLRDGAQLRGEGVAVVLADGVTRHCVFDFEALYKLEQGAGTLQAWLDEVGEGGYSKRKLWAVALGLESGLYRYADPRMQEDPRYLPTNLVRRQLRFKDMDEYLDAVMEAFWQAMGQPDSPPDADPKGEADSSAAPSPGGPTTPSPSLASAAATTSSGA